MSQSQLPASDPLSRLMEIAGELRSAAELAPGLAELVQTHISAVLIGHDLVLKLKKPVDFGFVDYSTLELRKQACEAEVRLNRRLCPDLYWGVVPITEGEHGLQLGGGGEAIEYGVLMRKLPEDKMLTRAIEENWVSEDHIETVAAALFSFQAAAYRGPDVDSYGSPAVLRQKWDVLLGVTEPFIGKTIEEDAYKSIVERLDHWMSNDAPLFESRVTDGKIYEGHGDVRCESICLTDPVAIYDCVEFNASFRCIDAACELAFLAMDLAARGRPDLGNFLCDQYVAKSDDLGLFALLPFYQSYLAYVRGRVLSFEYQGEEMSTEERERAFEGARGYFDLSLDYARPMPATTVVCVSGLSGVGKTGVARSIGHFFGTRVISADAVRHDLYGTGGLLDLEHGIGPYSEEANRETYATMLERARVHLERGESVVLDATFRRAEHRSAAADLAREFGARFRLVDCRVAPEVARWRLEHRVARREGLSGATVHTLVHQLAELEPVDEFLPEEHLELDTNGSRLEVSRTACNWLRQ